MLICLQPSIADSELCDTICLTSSCLEAFAVVHLPVSRLIDD